MTREVEILVEAELEAADAIRWYEQERPGLGAEFEAAIDVALSLLESDLVPSVPAAGAPGRRGVRRIVLRRFPFDVVFRLSASKALVVAFAHHSRRPGYWRHRGLY
jgi:hypothetical protein